MAALSLTLSPAAAAWAAVNSAILRRIASRFPASRERSSSFLAQRSQNSTKMVCQPGSASPSCRRRMPASMALAAASDTPAAPDAGRVRAVLAASAALTASVRSSMRAAMSS